MRTAKALQKIKHIKHVKRAIKFHEASKTRRAAVFKERVEIREARVAAQNYEKKWTRGDVKRARHNHKEDWLLGPLRPNRAVGELAETYGVMTVEQLQFPRVAVAAQREKNKLREKAGLELEWPIVVEDRKLFPIAENDRVVVIRGKAMNTIGIVKDINKDTHRVTLKDSNKVCRNRIFTKYSISWNTLQVYVRSDMFGAIDEGQELKHSFDFPFDVNDLRLVVPMTVTEIRDGHPVNVRQDVIVDNLRLELYTKGIDPYIGERTRENTIPPDNYIDPRTNEPIYHRYIAGTRQLIDWPLEKSIEDMGLPEEVAKQGNEGGRGWGTLIRDGASRVLSLSQWRRRQPTVMQSGLFFKPKPKEPVEEPSGSEHEPEEYQERNALYRPRNIQPKEFITRSYLPESSQIDKSPLDTPSQEEQRSTKELEARTKPRIVKTPQQVVWEYEAQQRRKTTFTSHTQRPGLEVSLLEAIGKHMEKNGVKINAEEDTSGP